MAGVTTTVAAGRRGEGFTHAYLAEAWTLLWVGRLRSQSGSPTRPGGDQVTRFERRWFAAAAFVAVLVVTASPAAAQKQVKNAQAFAANHGLPTRVVRAGPANRP